MTSEVTNSPKNESGGASHCQNLTDRNPDSSRTLRSSAVCNLGYCRLTTRLVTPPSHSQRTGSGYTRKGNPNRQPARGTHASRPWGVPEPASTRRNSHYQKGVDCTVSAGRYTRGVATAPNKCVIWPAVHLLGFGTRTTWSYV